MRIGIFGMSRRSELDSAADGNSDHGRSVGETHGAPRFVGARNSGLAHGGTSRDAGSAMASLVSLCLRLGVGVPELFSSLEKFQHLSGFTALWHTLHLPASGVLAPAYATAELLGALLLLAGWKTRIVAVFFVAELLAEVLLTKWPLMRLAGWMLEWQSLWVVLLLGWIGGGLWSLDGLSARRRAGDARSVAMARNRGDKTAGAPGSPRTVDPVSPIPNEEG